TLNQCLRDIAQSVDGDCPYSFGKICCGISRKIFLLKFREISLHKNKLHGGISPSRARKDRVAQRRKKIVFRGRKRCGAAQDPRSYARMWASDFCEPLYLKECACPPNLRLLSTTRPPKRCGVF